MLDRNPAEIILTKVSIVILMTGSAHTCKQFTALHRVEDTNISTIKVTPTEFRYNIGYIQREHRARGLNGMVELVTAALDEKG